MLIAPAGFGKTTLAEQWADVAPRRSAWYRARMSATDVAVLATGLAGAAAVIIPGCDARLRERLSVTASPSDEAHVLAEMLAEDLVDWPPDAWLVLDDHHSFDGTAASETFVATLVRHAPVNLLVTSRERPAWVASRDLLYGSVFELSQSSLAMTQEEASEVLVEWDRGRASGLIALADGWPAVIGLAGIAPDAAVTDAALPAELYAYFAEEVLQALGDEVREGLSVLAIPPVLDSQIASALLGPERARRVCAEGLAAGILVDRGGRLDVHPLAREFRRTTGSFADGAAIDATIAVYAHRHDWEAAGELVQQTRSSIALGPLLEDALHELLASAHLGTVEAWLDLMSDSLPIARLARAELDLRDGVLASAETLACGLTEDAAAPRDVRRRAALVAGRAAHLASRESEGLGYFALAEELALDDAERRDAAWGRVMCSAALEEPTARSLLDELSAAVSQDDHHELVRMADKYLVVSFHLGRIDGVAQARRAAQLLDGVRDPLTRCSFRSMYSGALNLTCSYHDGLAVSEAMLEDATDFRVSFAIPHAYAAIAAALIGLRMYGRAHEALDLSDAEARRLGDEYAIVNTYANRVRCLTQELRAADACAIELPDSSSSVRGIAAEGTCSRALALACNNRLAEAEALIHQVAETTKSVEPVALASVVEAIIAVRRRSVDLTGALDRGLTQAFETGAIDMLVCGYRSCPDLLGALLANPATRERTLFAVSRAADDSLLPDDQEPSTITAVLTPREREVHGLVCEGLSNQEIATALFLSEATVKVHVHHIFDKTGIRNRAGLIMLAANEKRRQAAPTKTGDESSDSEQDSGLVG